MSRKPPVVTPELKATRIQRGPAPFVHRLLDPGGLSPPEPFNP